MSSTLDKTHPRHRVLVVGSYVQDHVWTTDRFPQPGETRRALGFSTGPGGKGFNQAIACFRQQGDVLFLGAIGNDGLGRSAREFAHAEGLDCAWLSREGISTATAGIIVNAQGANQIMVDLGANLHLDPNFINAHESTFSTARVVLVQLENNLDAVRAALESGRRFGLLNVLNPAPMHTGVDARLLSMCDVITPNETEFSMLLDQVLSQALSVDAVASSSDESLHAHCRKLGVGTVVITLGAKGCFVSHDAKARRGDERDFYRMNAEQVKSVDTTGAGDAFNGALVANLSCNPDAPFAEAVRHANRVAALSTEKMGAAVSVPTLAEVQARFPA